MSGGYEEPVRWWSLFSCMCLCINFSVHYGLKRLGSAVPSSSTLQGLPTHNGQKLVSIPVNDQAKFYQNKLSGGALIFRHRKQTICTEGANTLETSISVLTLQMYTRNLMRELSLNGKPQKKTETTEEWSLTRLISWMTKLKMTLVRGLNHIIILSAFSLTKRRRSC